MANALTFRDANLRPGMSIGFDPTNVALIADNQYVQVAYQRVGFLRLTSDNTTSTARTFTLSSGAIDGQVLYIHFVSGASTAAELADSGNCKLSATWSPTLDDTLTLMWDATSAAWRELSRADN